MNQEKDWYEVEVESSESITSGQRKSIENVMEHLDSVIDFQKVREWTKKNENLTVFLFGSRTQGNQTEESDMDVMIILNGQFEWTKEEIQIFLKENHQRFSAFLKKEVLLDFKLNISDDEDYFGFTYNKNLELRKEVDFHFHFYEIPSYVQITSEKVAFVIVDTIENVFDQHHFRHVK